MYDACPAMNAALAGSHCSGLEAKMLVCLGPGQAYFAVLFGAIIFCQCHIHGKHQLSDQVILIGLTETS